MSLRVELLIKILYSNCNKLTEKNSVLHQPIIYHQQTETYGGEKSRRF